MRRSKRRQYFLTILIVGITLFIFCSLYTDWFKEDDYNQKILHLLRQQSLKDWKNSRINRNSILYLPKILLWTPFFGHYELYYYGITQTARDKCPAKCDITTDKLQLLSSDAVVFHIRDITSVPIPPFHDLSQVWIFLMKESPLNTNIDLTPYNDIFNWTMTYRLDSDIYHPYGEIISKIDEEERESKLLQNSSTNNQVQTRYLTSNKISHLTNKPKLVAWIVSNCKTQSKREALVRELQKYIQIDVYGQCGTYSCSVDDSHACYQNLASEYKFYLSFENSLCGDYVTEKYFDALLYDMIPIVYGSSNYSAISPLNSFIDARAFEDPKDLAAYIMYLDTRNDAYLKYFKWKENYKVINSRGWCELCTKLQYSIYNIDKVRKTYDNISSWWNSIPQPVSSTNDLLNSNNSVKSVCIEPELSIDESESLI